MKTLTAVTLVAIALPVLVLSLGFMALDLYNSTTKIEEH